MSLENSIFQNAISYFLFKNFCFTFRCTANLWTVHADRIARVLKTSGATQTVVLDISKAFYRAWHSGLLYKIMLYGFIKRCFILLSHFVLVKDFELFWSISHIPSVPLMLEYLRIFFLIFFALNEERKLKTAAWETESFIYRFKSIKNLLIFLKFLGASIISLYRSLELIAVNKVRKVRFHSVKFSKIPRMFCKEFQIFKITFLKLILDNRFEILILKR